MKTPRLTDGWTPLSGIWHEDRYTEVIAVRDAGGDGILTACWRYLRWEWRLMSSATTHVDPGAAKRSLATIPNAPPMAPKRSELAKVNALRALEEAAKAEDLIVVGRRHSLALVRQLSPGRQVVVIHVTGGYVCPGRGPITVELMALLLEAAR